LLQSALNMASAGLQVMYPAANPRRAARTIPSSSEKDQTMIL